jgi:3-hydroxybutyryl-CoA dehydrogenase
MAEIKSIGVIGAGQMGNGIAHVAALAGYDVLLSDVSAEQLAKAMGAIERNLTRQAGRGLIKDDEISTALSRIQTTADMSDLSNVDLAIEAASEKEDVKRAIFKSLCAVVRPIQFLRLIRLLCRSHV